MITNRSAFAQLLPVARRQGAFTLCLALCTLGLSLSASAQKPTLTTFDAPGAVGATIPTSINPAGAITGTYQPTNASSVVHGFLRARDGTFTTIDPPGSIFTFAAGINPAGAITGNFTDASGTHGFLRSP